MKASPSIILLILLFFAGAVYMTLDVMLSYSGPLAAMSKWVGISIALISFFFPKVGINILCVLCFYGDYYKKLAVYYGSASMMAVIEVLAVNMVVLGAILAGAMVKMLFSHTRPDKTIIALGFVTLLVTAALFAVGTGMTTRIQMAVNGGLYLGIAAVIAYYYREPGESLKISRLQYLLGMPWVVVAIHQYFNGFSDMDWAYARTFFSPVFSTQMYLYEEPRVFGLAGSASAFGAITFLFTFGLWHLMKFRHSRWLYGIGSLLFFAGLIVSTQRSILLMPFVMLVIYRLFKTAAGTRLFYIGTIGTVVLAISLSNVLLAGLGTADSQLAQATGTEGWSGKVVRVSTFSDRLKGWTRLTKASSYSLLGTGGRKADVTYADDDYSHDTINLILMNYGVVGLLACVVIGWLLARAAHGTVLNVTEPNERDTMAFTLAVIVMTAILTAMGGSNIHTVPINLILVTFIGHAAVIKSRLEHRGPPEKTERPALVDEMSPAVIHTPTQRFSPVNSTKLGR